MQTPFFCKKRECTTMGYGGKTIGAAILNVGKPAGKKLERVKGIEPSLLA
jgi:hypothetical protein